MTRDDRGRQVVLDRTKNGADGHSVRLEPWIVDILAAQPKGPYVFTVGGKRIPYPQVLHAFRDVAEEVGLPAMNLHGLRHSVISALGNAGVDLGVIQSITGHTNPRSTMVYLHRTTAGQEIGTQHLARLLGFEEATDTTTQSAER